MPAVKLSGSDKLTHLPAYHKRWSRAVHIQLKNSCISLSLSIRKSLKISQKMLSPFFFLISNSVRILLPGKWVILHDVGPVSEAKNYAVLYTSYLVWLLFNTWCKVKTMKLFHYTLVILKKWYRIFFLRDSSLLWHYELWTIPKLKNLYQLHNSSAEIIISSLGNTIVRRTEKLCLHSFVLSSCTQKALHGWCTRSAKWSNSIILKVHLNRSWRMYTHCVDACLHLYKLEKIGLYNISILI